MHSTYSPHINICTEKQIQKKEKKKKRYLEGAAVAVEQTAHLSFGTVVLVARQLQYKTNASGSSLIGAAMGLIIVS